LSKVGNMVARKDSGDGGIDGDGDNYKKEDN
jgi:hypothetical protein